MKCDQLTWQVSSYCDVGNGCVGVAGLDASMAVRDTTDPTGAVLTVDRKQFAAFVSLLRGIEIGC